MMSYWLRPAAIITLFVLAGAPAADQQETEKPARLETTACWFDIPDHRQAECAWFYPGDNALGVAVRLPVVRIPGANSGTGAQPLLYIPGGPGYPAGLDNAGMQRWWYWRDTSRWPQDLWLFDPRGTGLAQPIIDCPELRDQDRVTLASALTTETEMRNMARSALGCYQALGGKSALAAFNTQQHVRDIKKLIAVSQQKAWNIWAVSYGTRLVMQLLRSPGLPVRSLLLDSAYPPGINGFLQKPAQFSRALDTIAASCAQRPACAAAYPEINRQIDALLNQVDANPVTLDFYTADGLQKITLSITGLRLLWMLFLDSYLTHYETDTAAAVAAALAGDMTALEPMARRFTDTLLDPDFSAAVYFSAGCSEDWPAVTRQAFEAALESHARIAAYLRHDWQQAVCRFWNAGELPKNYQQPVNSEVPVLFLSGQFDPATPPAWSAAASNGLPNATHVVFRGASHTVTFNNHCAMRSVDAFLEQPDAWRRPDCLLREQVDLPGHNQPDKVK